MVRFFRTMSGLLFFRSTFSDFFRAQGGPKVDFVYHKTGEIAYLELGEMRSPECEHSHQGTRVPTVNIHTMVPERRL
jgi:hypothetical protein